MEEEKKQVKQTILVISAPQNELCALAVLTKQYHANFQKS